ncbi:hypothetical protein SK128_011412 [Halocaridina rubra]|uniref:Uncharacterized protein n=1 Tax=Halocaridina rubra TaxID=373956 RepID=A0AAN8ZYL4_HALRR
MLLLPGCVVTNEIIQTNYTSHIVDFMSFLTPEKPSQEMSIYCTTDTYLGTPEGRSLALKSPSERGWVSFRFNFTGNLSLTDSKGHSWLRDVLTRDCDVSSVNIKNGTFTNYCPSLTPKWLAQDGEELSIPFIPNETILELSSQNDFQPRFSVCGHFFFLKETNGDLHVIDKPEKPLPPSTYRLEFVLSSNKMTKILNSGREIFSIEREGCKLKRVKIHGLNTDIFWIAQVLSDKLRNTPVLSEGPDKLSKYQSHLIHKVNH